MMTLPSLSIRKRTLLLGFLPAILMYVLLISLFVWQQLQDLDKDVETVGNVLSRQLAASIEYPVISGNFPLLEPLVESAIQSDEVVRISITASDGQLLYERSTALYQTLGESEIKTYSESVTQDVMELSEFDEFSEPLSATSIELSGRREIARVNIELTSAVGQEETLYIVIKSMLWSILILALCGALARRMARSIAQPVEELTRVLGEITHGKYDTRSQITDGAELGALQVSANKMAEALKAAELAQESAMQDSISARLKAEQASKAKSEFLAIVSHELRTPINGAMGAVQLMANCSEQELQEYIGVADYSLGYLMELVEDMLTLVSSESNQLEVAQEYVLLESGLHNTLETLKAEAEKNNNQLHVSFDDLLVKYRVYVDVAKIRQLIRHLVGNAIKFTSSGYINVAIYLQTAERGTELHLDIVDSGVGIPEDKKKLMFEPFEQADSSFTRKFDGAGIGLAVCNSLIHAMKGDISLSDNLPSGTRVECKLPSNIKKMDSEPRSCSIDVSGRALIVEDNPVNRMVAEKMLKKVNFEAVSVESGDECLSLIRNNRYDLIFMDCHMPGMDGFVTTREVRKAERISNMKNTPIIALTANTSAEIRQRCIESGMDDYLAKPLKVDQLKEVIGRWLN
jgi:signal transduction histidine kinase/CheY-like chemotaxis protein